MSDMNSKKNQLEETVVNETSTSNNGGVSKWVWLGLALLSVCVGFIVVSMNPKPLQLENLVEGVTYEVIEIIQKEHQTTVDIVMEDEEPQVVEVVKAVSSAVKQHRSYQEEDQIVVQVYSELKDDELATGTNRPGLEDETHHYTAVITDTIKLYQLKDFSQVEANILATDNWYIENSKYEEDHLTGRVVLLDEMEEEVVYSQLKAIESEMTRFNEVKAGKETYFYTPAVEQVVYGYSSVYPTHLIVEKEITVTVSK